MHLIASLLPVLTLGALFVDAAPAPNPDPAWYLAPTTTTTTVAPHRSTFQERQSALSASSAAAASSSSLAAVASSSTTTPSATKFYLAPTTFATSIRSSAPSSASSAAVPTSSTSPWTAPPCPNCIEYHPSAWLGQTIVPFHLSAQASLWISGFDLGRREKRGAGFYWQEYPKVGCSNSTEAMSAAIRNKKAVWVSEEFARTYGGLDNVCGYVVKLADPTVTGWPYVGLDQLDDWLIVGGINSSYVPNGIAVQPWDGLSATTGSFRFKHDATISLLWQTKA
ncbi:hypothetical protein JCM8097_008221 [Rhodosporidiobolus ruineniae]